MIQKKWKDRDSFKVFQRRRNKWYIGYKFAFVVKGGESLRSLGIEFVKGTDLCLA